MNLVRFLFGLFGLLEDLSKFILRFLMNIIFFCFVYIFFVVVVYVGINLVVLYFLGE